MTNRAAARGDVSQLVDRFEALGRFLRVVTPHFSGATVPRVDPAVMSEAQALVTKAQARIDLGQTDQGAYTVVALAGATGSGKSSLFNALARMDLSAAGPLRPTTGLVHACVWGGAGANALLNWLAVDPDRRFGRESPLDAEDQATLRGLILLDLPDLDSVAPQHRVEADRLLDLVDLVVWVLDPQKYADASVHEDYLTQLGAARNVTVVVFNQVDRLEPADAARCLADLNRLVADGLPGVPIIATSTVTGVGVEQLRNLLERVVASRRAGLVRLEGELNDAVAALAPLVGEGDGEPAAEDERVTRHVIQELAGEFATAAGVSAVAAEAARAYLGQAAVPGWPINRHPGRTAEATIGRLTKDPLTSSGEAEVPPADPARVGFAIRRLAATSTAGLPAPWPDEVRLAASAGAEALPDELGRAVRAAGTAPPRAVGWWVARTVWWVAVAVALVGVGWLVWLLVQDIAAPELFGVAVPAWLVATGVVVAIVVVLLARWVALAQARRWRRSTERRLREATTSVAREAVAPVRAVLRDYARAQRAFREAGGPRRRTP